MYIMGITCFGHDSSAAIIKDGKLLTAVEEERFNRTKHTHLFPVHSIQHCLDEAGIGLNQLDHVGYYLKPWIGYPHYFTHFIKYFPRSLNLIVDRQKAVRANDYIAYGTMTNPIEMLSLPSLFKKHFPNIEHRYKFHFLEHHLCHQASSFLISPFEEAACLSVDGSGEWATTMLAHGKGNQIKILSQINIPHSLGTLYNSVCDYLGFTVLDGPGKVMGLASYGDPDRFYERFKDLVFLKNNGQFRVNMSYFNYHIQRTAKRCSGKFVRVFGAPRGREDVITQRHQDIAAALQRLCEDAMIHMASYLREKSQSENLCLSGGVALNSVANGKILAKGIFKNVFIQPAASDSGCSIGACFYIHNVVLRQPRSYVFEDACTGKQFGDMEILEVLEKNQSRIQYQKMEDTASKTARLLAQGKIIGWFQGRAEFGPRSLGCRSILADPRRAEMKDILNDKVKHRESFRPFAPSILAEKVGEYFETNYPSPFMLLVYRVKIDMRDKIPAITHVDQTGRVQTVEKRINPRYWQLIKEFERLTGIPVILNTSFNVQGMPIVNSPEDAVDCFLKTQMDYLVVGDYLITKDDTLSPKSVQVS